MGQQCFEDAVCLRSGMTYFNPEKYLVITDNVQYAPTGHTYWFNKNYFWFRYYWTCPNYENVSFKVSILISYMMFVMFMYLKGCLYLV